MATDQTFSRKDSLKILLASKDETKSNSICCWITNKTSNQKDGTFRCVYKETEIILFPIWKDKAAKGSYCDMFDVVIVHTDLKNEYDELKRIIGHKFDNTQIKAILSSESNSDWIKQEPQVSQLVIGSAPEKLLENIFQLDRELFQNLKRLFNKYDDDKSGFIDRSEISHIAKALGVDVQSEKFKQAVMTFDVNYDNRISFHEFVLFWKYGRFDSGTLGTIYEIHKSVNDFLYENLDFINLTKDIADYNETKFNKTNIDVHLSPEQSEIKKTRLAFDFSIGEATKVELANNYLSKFSCDLSSVKEDWISIGIFLKSVGMKSKEAGESLKECIKHLTEKYPVLAKIFTFEVLSYNYSVNVVLRIKEDVKSLLLFAVNNLLKLKDFIQAFELGFSINSDDSLLRFISASRTLASLLAKSEIHFDNKGIKEKVKIIIDNLFNQDHISLLQHLFLAKNLKLDYQGEFTELFNFDGDMNINCKPLENVIQFFKANLDHKLLSSLSRIELTCDMLDVFSNIQISSGLLN